MASPKPKRKPKPKKDASKKPQSERFKETARSLGAKSRDEFERAFRAVVPPKKRPDLS
jgi:hypothetical protein